MEQVDVVIIGAGFGGICAGIELARAGRSFVILERASEIGGTWRDNTYPGAACDVQSHLYSLASTPNPAWSRRYAGWQEIQAYLLDVVRQHDLRRHIRLGAEVTSAAFDGRGWTVHTADGGVTWARYLVAATGPLHVPSVPRLPGADTFRGRAFHSARWDHTIDLSGLDVVSIGTGASAIQYVPEIARRVRRLHVVQRTPAWVLPRDDAPYADLTRALFTRVPALRALHRAQLYWRNEVRILALAHAPVARAAQRLVALHIQQQVGDPALAERLTPTYTLGCKRALLSNDWYPTFRRDNVELVTTGVSEVVADGVITADGVHRRADVIVYGTGFEVDPRRQARGLNLTNAEGVTLASAWAAQPRAWRGTMVAGFPNLFLLLGPNTGLGHTSVLLMMEAQVGWMLQAIAAAERRGATVAPRPEAQDRYNEALQARLAGTVWRDGCQSWYQDDGGHNFSLWPRSTVAWRRQMAQLGLDELLWTER